ncbi:NUDIX domain-containing protein [Chitinimonas koreensis]|uniref:NUDIX domain-containing protein n=1 Tax=Chitinimonas koreensis TaxID=356302 RepID=UPI000421AF5A|nr:NUDIX domain-containing protein [Chitinimonas koreensis]QNM96496.1 NUDIX domain-containing protein [Chitinimonas koreensis]
MSLKDRIRMRRETLLSDNWYVLRKYEYDYLRGNGEWQAQVREAYDRGNGAVILLYNLAHRSVVLVRQFRLPVWLNGHDDLLIEAPAGLLDDADPAERIRAEVAEETGLRVDTVRKVFECYMSPGSVTEKLHFFVAEYDPADRAGDGGGLAEEGEDIEVLELSFDEALAMLARGEIVDAKTIMLLQYAQLHLLR